MRIGITATPAMPWMVDYVVEAERPEVIYVLSDGYENAPAGRFDEVVCELRGIGVDVPIYHLSPVFAAESGGVRSLSPKLSTLPVARPDALGLSFLRGLVQAEPLRGIQALLRAALMIENSSEVSP